MEPNNKVVLAIFAHPDDELSCFGTLAALQKKGCAVHLLILTNGENSQTFNGSSRHSESRSAAESFHFHFYREHFTDGHLSYDAQLISTVDDYLSRIKPDIVITHFPQADTSLGHHQDHVAAAACAINCTLRSPHVSWILQAEPIVHASGFQPNFYFDITDSLPDKLRALEFFQIEKSKYFLSSDAFVTKGRYWAFQAYADERALSRFCEPFSLVKGLQVLSWLLAAVF